MKIENFVIKSMKNCLLYNTDDTLKGIIPYGDGITISNSSNDVEVRSGEGNQVIYSMASEFASDVSGSFIMNMDLFSALTGTEGELVEKDTTFTDTRDYDVPSRTITLPFDPLTGGRMNVFALDKDGLRTKLTLGNGTDEGTYSVTGKQIQVPSTVKRAKVIFDYSAMGVEFKKQAKDTKTYKLIADCIFVNLATNEEKVAQFKINKLKLAPNFDVSASNTEFAKVELAGKCLLDQGTNTNWILAVKA